VSGVALLVRLEASLAMVLYSVLAHFQRPCLSSDEDEGNAREGAKRARLAC